MAFRLLSIQNNLRNSQASSKKNVFTWFIHLHICLSGFEERILLQVFVISFLNTIHVKLRIMFREGKAQIKIVTYNRQKLFSEIAFICCLFFFRTFSVYSCESTQPLPWPNPHKPMLCWVGQGSSQIPLHLQAVVLHLVRLLPQNHWECSLITNLIEGLDGAYWQLTNGLNFNGQLTNGKKYNWQLIFVPRVNWQLTPCLKGP